MLNKFRKKATQELAKKRTEMETADGKAAARLMEEISQLETKLDMIEKKIQELSSAMFISII